MGNSNLLKKIKIPFPKVKRILLLGILSTGFTCLKARQTSFPYVYDQYTEARGESKMLEITCAKCHKWVLDYQKDGPGTLVRMYVDRIHHPRDLREHTFSAETISSTAPLRCWNCEELLAEPIIYCREGPYPETRPAYRILITGREPAIRFEENENW
ncbi:MAG TPA: hypothetical protein VGZ69_00900 [Candidatus Rhabdochlamydia sp.]|jgi:hypothetical protein|nr:hypothetical protein [Candidatus Rhabdochlamydia sp.]